MTLGHSGTPLAETLGLKRGMRCWFHNMPESVRTAIAPEATGVEEQPTASDGLHCAILFVAERDKLERELTALRPLLAPNGYVWVAWPAQEATDLDATIVGQAALPAGLVEGAACPLDSWSALQLMIRKDDR